MTEQVQQPNTEQIDEYLQQHPNAVQDVEQARVMATAGDQYESKAVKLREEAVQNLGNAAYHAAYGEVRGADVGNAVIGIERANKQADTVYRAVGSSYERVIATKR